MPLLSVQGWEVLLASRDNSKILVRGGDQTRAHSGPLRSTRRWQAHEYPGRTILLEQIEADTLFAVLDGHGHAWGFEESGSDWQWSSKQLGAETTTGGSSTTESKWGSRALKVAASSANITWDLKNLSEWTAFVWRTTDYARPFAFLSNGFPAASFSTKPADGWRHVAVNSNGDTWMDGDKTKSPDTSFLDVTGNTLTIQSDSHPGERIYDDLLILPLVAADALVEAIAGLGRELTGPPRFSLAGDRVHQGPKDAMARDLRARFVKGTFQTLEFLVEEDVS